MSMTKRDFEAMASAVREARRDFDLALTEGSYSWVSGQAALDTVAEKLATACAEQYRGGYGFNRGRFLEACGVDQESASRRVATR